MPATPFAHVAEHERSRVPGLGAPSLAVMLVREATGEDLDAVLGLWAASRSAIAVTDDRREAVAGLVDDRSLLVAEMDGEVVGALIAAWDGWRGNMYRLAVRPSLRRRGIAAELVAAGHERLRARGASRVTALVSREDEVAKALWRSAGYDEDGQIARFVRNL